MEPKESERTNYLFFGILFAIQLITTTSSILLKENLAGSRMFFWFYALGQSAFEVMLFIVLATWILRYIGKIGFSCFIGFVFTVYALQFLDFVTDRILDLTFLEGVKAFILDETWGNFRLLLDASGISFPIWILIFTSLGCIPLIGVGFYHATDLLAKKYPLPLRKEIALQILLCIPAALFFWDYTASKVIHPDSYTAFVKSLPWKRTFLTPHTIQLSLKNRLLSPPTEEETKTSIAQIDLTVRDRPNIYLFVVETLRADFMTEEIAPNLYTFGKQNISADLSLANANFTNISWFSIFHSQFPFFWYKRIADHWSTGSPALQIFKKLGYQIKVYTSAELEFYGMEQLLFGQKNELLDSYQTFHHEPKQPAWNSDRKLIEQLDGDSNSPSGQLFIVFLDATHFDYSWPETTDSLFNPYASEIAFFRTYPTKSNIEKIKNRYRNAIHYMDHLFGSFLEKVDPNALIAFTGDHGEEFFDHGHLFHGSHLSQEQLAVPIYFRIGNKQMKVPILSQMDIMPTLLDAITHTTFPILEGQSALRPIAWPYAFSSRFNAKRSPYEFALQDNTYKLIAQFNDKDQIFDSTGINILSLRSCCDLTISEYQENAQQWVMSQFGPALNRLFPKE